MIKDLASLLAPLPERIFLDHFLAKKRLHLKAADPERACPLLPWGVINRLIESDRQTPSAFLLRRDGTLVPTAMYCRAGTRDRVRASGLHALLAQGASIVIDHIDELVPEIGQLGGSLERRLGCTVWINAYLTFGNGSALKPHHDTHDVLILQVHGRKRWRSFGSSTPVPIGPSRRGTRYDTVAWEDWLEPGDALYLPRGEAHEAIAEQRNSAHLTIGMQPQRGVDLFEWLADKAAAQELFRADLPRQEPGSSLSAFEAQLKQRMHALVDELNLVDFLAADDQRRAPQTLVNLNIADHPVASAVIMPTPRRRMPLATDRKGAAELLIGGETHRLSSNARRVLSHLLDHDAQACGAVVAAFGSTMGEEQVCDAVQELVAHGLAAVRPLSDRS
jgi:ribosomal protein L16 Arg81 hydroxylase